MASISCGSGRVSAYLNFFRGWGLLLPLQLPTQTHGLQPSALALSWKPSFVARKCQLSRNLGRERVIWFREALLDSD